MIFEPSRLLFALGALVSCVACHGSPSSSPAAVTAPRGSCASTDEAAGAGGVKAQRLVLHAARALVPRSGVVIAPAWVEIDGSHITRVATSPPVDARAARELGDVTIVPGLIDAHSHLLHVEAPLDEASMVNEVVMLTESDRALRGAVFAKQMLHAGFTTVRDLGNAGRGGDVALRRAIDANWILGPKMLVSTRAIAPPGGQFPKMNPAHAALVEQEYAIVKSPDDGRAAVRQAIHDGADVIKIIAEQDGRAMTPDEIRAVVEAAHAHGKKVAAHVLTEKLAEVAVRAGVDSCDHAYNIADATLREMAQKGIFLVPTDYPLDYYAKFAPQGPRHDAVLASMKKLRAGSVDRLARAKKFGVRIAAGSDAYVETPLSDRGKEASLIFGAYAEAGLTPLEVLQAATSNAADLLGLPPNTTSLEAGSPATLVAVRGDPAVDVGALRRVALVVLRGRVID